MFVLNMLLRDIFLATMYKSMDYIQHLCADGGKIIINIFALQQRYISINYNILKYKYYM